MATATLGDGEAAPAFWIAVSGEWHIFQPSTSYADMILSWGREDLGDRPVPADYDGDGKTDPAVRRSGSGIWYYLKSSTGYEEWGSRKNAVLHESFAACLSCFDSVPHATRCRAGLRRRGHGRRLIVTWRSSCVRASPRARLPS